MQDAGIHMAEHAVLQAKPVEQCAELGDVVREMLRWNRRILDERLWPCLPFDIAQQADRTLAHDVDALDCLLADCKGVAQAPNRGRSEEHTSELQSQSNLVCRLLLEKK